jgi:hypothetical protein
MTLSQIAKEFDEKVWPLTLDILNDNGAGSDGKFEMVRKETKAYWLSHFRTLVEEMKKEIKDKRQDVPTEFDTGSEFSTPRIIRANGFNYGLNDALSVLNKYL